MYRPPSLKLRAHLPRWSGFFLALLLILAPFSAQASLTRVFVNGMRVDAYPITRQGTIYLPIQLMAQTLKAEIVWDSRLHTVSVDGQIISTPIIEDDGRVYVPAEALVKVMGGSITFDGANDRLLINSKSSSAPSFKPAATAKSLTPAPAATAQTTLQPASQPVASQSLVSQPTPTQPAQPAFKSALPAVAPPQSSSALAPAVNRSPTPLAPVAKVQTPVRAAPVAKSAPAAKAQSPVAKGGVYVPRQASNSLFQVTVTNLETVDTLKNFYHPRAGYKYVVVYLSQQNISKQVQIYTGKFSLSDQNSRSYPYLEGLSNFWLVILRPFGINFGYLVFEVPVDSNPASLVLHSLNQAPLAVSL